VRRFEDDVVRVEEDIIHQQFNSPFLLLLLLLLLLLIFRLLRLLLFMATWLAFSVLPLFFLFDISFFFFQFIIIIIISFFLSFFLSFFF